MNLSVCGLHPECISACFFDRVFRAICSVSPFWQTGRCNTSKLPHICIHRFRSISNSVCSAMHSYNIVYVCGPYTIHMYSIWCYEDYFPLFPSRINWVFSAPASLGPSEILWLYDVDDAAAAAATAAAFHFLPFAWSAEQSVDCVRSTSIPYCFFNVCCDRCDTYPIYNARVTHACGACEFVCVCVAFSISHGVCRNAYQRANFISA